MKTKRRRAGWPPTIKGENLVGAAICLVVFMALATPIIAQSTLTLTFESAGVGDTPIYIGQPNPGEPKPQVADDSTAPWVPPLEGTKFLVAAGAISIASPTGNPITSYTLHYYIPATGEQMLFSPGDVGGTPPIMGAWQTYNAQFSTPLSRFPVFGYFIHMDRVTPAPYALESIDLVTIPEPSPLVLLLLGGCGLACSLVPRWRGGRKHG